MATKTHCAPGKGDKISCYNRTSLIKMARALNRKKRLPKKIRIGTNRKKIDIWRDIRREMSNRCNSEVCWIDQDFIKQLNDPELTEKLFPPKMPESWKQNPNTWLSTTDINAVMEQYENLYTDFLFIGPVPSDCPNGIQCELSNFNPNRLSRNGIKRVGIIYNLDKHNQPGSHWVAVYIDMKRDKDISYYDSYGELPPPAIAQFLVDTYNKLDKRGVKMKVGYNQRRHQMGGSECGMYSMNYIINRLKGDSMLKATNRSIPDRVMEGMREKLYRSS